MHHDDLDYHNAVTETAFPIICRRTNQQLRDHVDLMVWAVEAGELTVREAAVKMRRNSVPLDVTRRVLTKARRKTN